MVDRPELPSAATLRQPLFHQIPERDAKALMSSEWFVQTEPEPPPGARYSDLFEGL